MNADDFKILNEGLIEIQKKLFEFQHKEENIEILRKLKLIDAELIDALHNMETLQKLVQNS